jgi:hypothetical protein
MTGILHSKPCSNKVVQAKWPGRARCLRVFEGFLAEGPTAIARLGDTSGGVMQKLGLGVGLGVMDDEEREKRERGDAIRQRRERLGIRSVRELAAWMRDNAERLGMQHPVSVDAVTAAEKGKARLETYGRIDAFLDRLELEVGMVDRATLAPDEVQQLGDGMIEVKLTGNFGVSAIVKGPVTNTAELQSMIELLVQQMRAEPKSGS